MPQPLQTGACARDEAEATVTQLAEVARVGKSIAINESVEATTINLTFDIDASTGSSAS